MQTRVIRQRRDGTYANSTGTLTIDLGKGKAHSYGHWQLMRVSNFGTLYVNEYKYSPTTAAHIRALKRFLTDRGYLYNLETVSPELLAAKRG